MPMLDGLFPDKRLLAWALACLVLSTAAANAQAPGEILGTISDATGGSLPGATVALGGPVSRLESSGQDGRFRFQNLPDGSYDLTVTLNGFAPVVRVVRVSGGQTTTLSITLTIQLLEQVVVSADRTGDRELRVTPMAVSALDGAELDRMQARNVGELAGRAPSVTFSQNTGLAQLTIRGIGTNAVFAGSDPASAVYIDGVYLARPAMALADFVDLERAEVLRGPQGTLYGRNAVGGSLNLITKTPSNALEASARVTVGTLGTARAEGRVSGPLVRDRVMGSVSFVRDVSRGFVRDVSGPSGWMGGTDTTAARGKLLTVFGSRADLVIAADASHSDAVPLTYAKVLSVKPGFQVGNPGDALEVRTSTPTTGRQVQSGASARLAVHLPGQVTLTSLTAYRAVDFDVNVDTDITELDLTASHVHEIHHQWSQETILSRQGTKASWVGGAFLFGDVDRQPTTIAAPSQHVENRLEVAVRSRSEAAFVQANVSLTSAVSAIAGLRYTRERKTIDNATTQYTIATPAVRLPAGFAYTDEISHDAWTPKVGLEARLTPNAFVYASATRGFKSGGFNISSPQAGRGFAPERVWSYEGGLKTALFGGRARSTLTVFHADYSDLQVQIAIRPGVLDISNAATARINGVEWETTARLSRWLTMGGHAAWLDAVYLKYIAVGVGGVTGDVAGKHLTNAPVWSGRVWMESSTRLGDRGSLSIRAETRGQNTVYFTPFNDDIQRQPGYGLIDLSVEFRPRAGRWSVDIFAQNLSDARFITGTFSSPPPAIGGRPGEPRRIGVRLGVQR